MKRMVFSISKTMDGCMPSVGSSRRRQLRFGDKDAGDGELLLLAAAQIAALPVLKLLEAGEQIEYAVGDDAFLPLASRPTTRFSCTVR